MAFVTTTVVFLFTMPCNLAISYKFLELVGSIQIPKYITHIVGRYRSIGIATRYGLDGPRIESRLRRDFPHQSSPALGR
jgi:hypothetical protein